MRLPDPSKLVQNLLEARSVLSVLVFFFFFFCFLGLFFFFGFFGDKPYALPDSYIFFFFFFVCFFFFLLSLFFLLPLDQPQHGTTLPFDPRPQFPPFSPRSSPTVITTVVAHDQVGSKFPRLSSSFPVDSSDPGGIGKSSNSSFV